MQTYLPTLANGKKRNINDVIQDTIANAKAAIQTQAQAKAVADASKAKPTTSAPIVGGASPASPYPYEKYQEAQAVTDARNALTAHAGNRVPDWTGGTYGQALQQAMDRIQNREAFSYDLNGDALYQQYRDRYINQGRMAMGDTVAQASALTGGYGNSYAVTAGNQAYQQNLQALNDVVPELYQMAYDKYNREGEELYNQYGLINNAYQTEYGQYRDQVGDWNAEYDRLANAYNQALSTDYGMWSDDFGRKVDAYNAGVSQAQYASDLAYKYASLNENRRQFDASQAAALEKAKASASATSKTSGTKATAEETATPEIKAVQSDKTDAFMKKQISPEQFARQNGYVTDGRGNRYTQYSEYIASNILNALDKKEISEEEAKWLYDHYNI